jgi:uncharacterized membrane protein YesL
MAGFFGLFDYTKPGPGVPKDAPPKSPFIVFFEILQRKFWNFVKINMMYLVFNLPAFLAGMFVMLMFFPNIIPDAMESPEKLFNDVIMKFVLLTVIMCVPMITTGPVQAGFAYILRNYSREEHAFIWSDFKDSAVSNFRQIMIVSTVKFIITFLTLISIRAYWILNDTGQMPGLVGLAGQAVMILMLIVFASMNIYIYPLMVTFELTLKQLYKNALIFAVIRFIPNLGVLLLNTFLVFLSFGIIIPFNPLIGFIPYIFLVFSLTGFIVNFFAHRGIRKHILSRLEEEELEDDDEDEEDEDEDEDEDDKSEYYDDDEDFEDDGGEDDVDEAGGDDGPDEGGRGHGREGQPTGSESGSGAGIVGDDGVIRYY